MTDDHIPEPQPPTPAQRKIIDRLTQERREFARALDRYAIAVMLHAIGSEQACALDVLEEMRLDYEIVSARFSAQLRRASGDVLLRASR